MGSTRIGKKEECCLYINDASFMLPSSSIKSRAELESEKHGGLASQSPEYVDDYHKQLELINWDGDIIKLEASSLFDLLLSIGDITRTKKTMKETIKRLKKIIHKNY